MENTETVQTGSAAWPDVVAASAAREEKAAQLAMPPRRFDELLPCKLTDEELRERGDELVKVLAAVDEIEAEKKLANDQFKARIQIQEARARELRTAIETKREDRSVECVESYELRLGVARTTRVDTGEQIRERALRSSELQPTLPGTEAEAAPDDQLSLDDTVEVTSEAGEGPCADADGAAIDNPQAVLDAEPVASSDEDVAAKPRRGRKARA
jgi:hypothetical protein